MQETRMRYTKETEGVKDERYAEDHRGRCPQERDRGRGERQGPYESKVPATRKKAK